MTGQGLNALLGDLMTTVVLLGYKVNILNTFIVIRNDSTFLTVSQNGYNFVLRDGVVKIFEDEDIDVFKKFVVEVL